MDGIPAKPASTIAALIFLLTMSASAPAQSLMGRVGVVNMNRAIAGAPQFVAANARLRDEFADRQLGLMTMQQELEEAQETFRRDVEVMGADERAGAERAIREAERELVRDTAQFQEDLNYRRNEELLEIQQEVLEELRTFAQQEDYELVVTEPVYFSSNLDITEYFLEALGEKYTDQGTGLRAIE